MKYKYELRTVEKPLNETYTREELEQLTTLQLREICSKEKIVIGVAFKLDRNHIISTILKYRGAKLFTFIDEYIPDSFERVISKFGNLLEFIDESKQIQSPTKISIYKNINTTINDNYVVDRLNISNGNMFLLDENKNICGILNLVKSDNKYYITCNCQLLKYNLQTATYKNYSLGFLDEVGSKYVYNFYYKTGNLRTTKLKCYTKIIPEFMIMETETTEAYLVIDFGTSNTSAGAYLDRHYVNKNIRMDLEKSGIFLDKINKVKFTNTLSRTPQISEIIPTVISVKKCDDPDNVSYRYGYDAIKQARKHSYNNPSSIFYGFKKWINDYEKFEEISDEDGNIVLIPRKDIIRDYFKNIISLSEQQHKCVYKNLHITSPVKQKQQFIEMYKEILYEYEVASYSALDEGIAVLYNSISNQIENKNFEDGEDYAALIIDCGGGTTDLTSCTYFIEDNQITYKLNMVTTYANGETNFGGNNITFRIFQYLKILFTKYYNNEKILRVENILDLEISDIYRAVDSNGIDKIYETFERLYENCEDTIPTKFEQHKHDTSDNYIKIKSNFYFLWNLAEKIKIDFYQSVGVNQTDFHQSGIVDKNNDRKILSEESWRLNIFKDSVSYERNKNIVNNDRILILNTEFPDIIVSKDEISALIKADIYYIIKKFIEPIYLDDQLNNFNFIKLTGQTCKIDIFRDALKEFVPGRIIESSKKNKTVQDYKLTCLEGAIKYQNAHKIGLIAPTIQNQSPITPYKLVAYTHSGTEVIMISSLEQISKSYGFVSRNIDTESVELILKLDDDRIMHRYSLQTNVRYFRETSYEETSREYSDKIFQDDIDSIVEDEMKIFTFAFDDRWGFYVLPLARKNKLLYIGEKRYFPFENDEWEINFFDGRK